MSLEVNDISQHDLAAFTNSMLSNRHGSADQDSDSSDEETPINHINIQESELKSMSMPMPMTIPMMPLSMMAMDTQSSSDGHINIKKRSLEEEHCIVLKRNSSTASKSSNTKYKCLYCNFEFVGGPQKIRVHLTGKRENGTRLSKCEKVPEEIRALMESRMRSPKEMNDIVTLMEESELPATNLPSRSVEENHCYVLERSSSAQSKSSNTRYKCIYCRFKFVGGPQKIRVHLTGLPEGGTRVAKCPRAPAEVVAVMENRRKVSKTSHNDGGSPAHPLNQQLQQMAPLIDDFGGNMHDQVLPSLQQQQQQQQLQQHLLLQQQREQQHQQQQHHQLQVQAQIQMQQQLQMQAHQQQLQHEAAVAIHRGNVPDYHMLQQQHQAQQMHHQHQQQHMLAADYQQLQQQQQHLHNSHLLGVQDNVNKGPGNGSTNI